MNLRTVVQILGLVVAMFSLSMLPPIAVSTYYADGAWPAFGKAFVAILGLGIALWLPFRRARNELRLRDGFLVVALFWSVLGLLGGLPMLLVEQPNLSLTDAVFESVSGFTTTGATTIVGLDSLPRSFLWYRQQIQWLGGGGIMVLAVALFPLLGIGGMQLFRAETPGPVKDEKITPRIAQTAKALWAIYLALTFACAAAYRAAGMGWFDAAAHAMTTMSTGGFSTYDASLAHFDSYAIEMITVAFMFAGSVNYTLHFLAWRNRSAGAYITDPQFRAFALVCAGFVVVSVAYLMIAGTHDSLNDAFRYASFQVVSFQTSTGYASADFAAWPGALPVLLVLTTFIGGCSGSTAGGMKVIRWQLAWRQGSRELKRLMHPHGELPVKLGGRLVPPSVLAAVTGFFAIYLVLFGAGTLALMFVGLDQITAWTAAATSINNLGPGLGEVASNFTSVSAPAKWICIFLMLTGRLEVFTILVLFTPAFWRA
jgi:trk system potassium uptake protein TrkH